MGRLAYEAIASAMNDAYGAPMSTFGAERIKSRCAICSLIPTPTPS
jgi:hypothetical protein